MNLGEYKVEIALFATTIAVFALIMLSITNSRAKEIPMATECEQSGGVLVIIQHRSAPRQPICFDKSAILYMKDPK